MKSELWANTFKIFHQFKMIKTLSGRLTTKDKTELKPWYTDHIDLIVTYIHSIIQQHPGGSTINNNVFIA